MNALPTAGAETPDLGGGAGERNSAAAAATRKFHSVKEPSMTSPMTTSDSEADASDVDAKNKKVHFQESTRPAAATNSEFSSPAPASSSGLGNKSPAAADHAVAKVNGVDSGSGGSSGSLSSAGSLLSLNPSDEVIFNQTAPQGDLLAKVQVTNVCDRTVAYKIKTTSPEKYRVRPSMSALAPGATAKIEIHISSSQIGSPVSLVRDKFLITVISVPTPAADAAISQAQLTEMLKTTKPEAQYRLRCVLAAENQLITRHSQQLQSAAVLPTTGAADTTATTAVTAKQIESLTKKISVMSQSQEQLRDELSAMHRLVVICLALIVCLLLGLIWVRSAVISHTASICGSSGGSLQHEQEAGISDSVDRAEL